MRYFSNGFLYIKLLMLFFCFDILFAQSAIRKNGDVLYLSNTIIIKLKDFPSVRTDGSAIISANLQTFLGQFQIKKIEAVFPAKATARSSSLGKILMVSYESDIDPYYLSSKIKNNKDIEWAEPKFVYELDFDPNDPSYPSQQWNLTKILASQAWDITQGDISIIIGIIDTGVDWDHPDLNANIRINPNEIPGNGIDDDLNGFVDDIHGWDFGGLNGTPDNDPTEDQSDHGTHVAGISSAVTNNGVGISSIGFKSKLLPVKTSRNDVRNEFGQALIYYGYEGIAYAADNGAKVINCSWGGSGYSIFSQDVINYVTSVGVLVIAAAGNSGTNTSHYPSGYDNVLSVASTNSNDTKSSFSTYGQTVDVSAPGNGIYSTWQNNTYATLSGTSMASPLTAGVAALVFSVFPSYTPQQIGEQIRVNSDNVDALNTTYAQLMGKGRINAYASVTNVNSVSVRAIEVDFSDEAPGGNGDGVFLGGETISVGVRFINYLNPTASLQVTLQSKNNYSTVSNGTFNAGSKTMLEEFNNLSSKFTFTLNPSLPENVKLDFILNYSAGSYLDYQWLNVVGNPTYATQGGNDVSLTITSKGALGFNDYGSDPQLQGDGFKYLEGSNLLYEGALILGTSSTQISDGARGNNASQQNSDFTVVQPFILNIPGTISDQQGSAIFNDDGAGSNKIGITTKLESFSFADIPNNNYIILKYYFTNNTASEINNLHAGLFFDWDIIDGSGVDDITAYDTLGNLSYTYNTSTGPETWITTAIISGGDYSFRAIQNDGENGGFSIYDGFSDSEKWESLSNGIEISSAGPQDISHVVGAGPFSIQPGEIIDVGFVIGAGLNLSDLQTIVANAKVKYPTLIVSADNEQNSLPTAFELSQNYPNPFNPKTNIEYRIPYSGFVSVKVYDFLGREVSSLVNENKEAGTYSFTFDATSFSSGIYFYKLTAGSYSATKKMILLK